MDAKVLFKLYFSEGENAGKKLEVMDVDWAQWNALTTVVKEQYAPKGVLQFLENDLPIHLSRDEFIGTEAEMREVDTETLSKDAYVALFSLDVFIRQLDELAESDVMFELSHHPEPVS
ncbi:MAG: hypothetical protein AAF824_06225 [Bacteroidota bacterium]